ncbi:MAG: CPBP family intramembrane glutamic endopeptidase [Candidatus Acidiferrales bacterium]
MSTEPTAPTEPIAPIAPPPPPPRWKGIFLRADGLRSGWRIAIFVAIVTALSAMMIGVLLRAGAKLPTGGVVTPGIILTQEIPLLLATLAAALMMSHIEQRPFVSYGLPLQSAFGGQFWRGVVWGLVMIAVAILAIAVAGGVSFNGIALHGRGLILQTLLWAVVFLSVGLWEEFFWRGYVLATLADGVGFWSAASLTSALFAATHLNNHGEGWMGIPQIFLISMFFCLTLRRTGSLWFAVGLHAAWDYGETFIFSSPDSGTVAPGTLLRSTFHGPNWLTGGTIGPEGSVIGVLVVLLGMLLYAWLYPARE